jgi:hypothetical protein
MSALKGAGSEKVEAAVRCQCVWQGRSGWEDGKIQGLVKQPSAVSALTLEAPHQPELGVALPKLLPQPQLRVAVAAGGPHLAVFRHS